MSYKHTLSLPQTNYPMWVEQRQFEVEQLSRGANVRRPTPTDGRFHLHGGPPFANGGLHLGHFFNLTLKDLTARSKALAGYQVTWSDGWDCHGLPLEQLVTKANPELRQNPAMLRAACQAEATKWAAMQREQMNRLGLLEREYGYTTMNPGYEAGELMVFARFQELGLMYQANRPTLWSYGCQTALAEAEVEYQNRKSPSAYVRFKAADFDLLVWTTQPWTLLTNEAVAFHPEVSYVNCQGLVMAQTTAEAWGLTGTEVDLTDVVYQKPYGGSGRLLPATYVSATDGTGLVHVAPAHGPDDYKLGL